MKKRDLNNQQIQNNSKKPKMNTMKKLTLVIAIALFTFNSTTTQAQTCMGFGDVIKSVWEEVYTVAHPIGRSALALIPGVKSDGEIINAISSASASLHNAVFNGNDQSWTTLGKRSLHVDKDQIKQYGTLRKAVVGGVRVFATTGMLWDRVEIEIEKIEGRAQTEVIICTWDMESGAKNNYTEYTFPNGKNTSSKKFIIRNVHGKSISVKLRNRSAAYKFKYAIKTKGFVNMAKQRARTRSNTNGLSGMSKMRKH